MVEDDDAPLILGRPFMKTARMSIDIDDGLKKVRVLDEEVTFNIFEAMKHSKDKVACFQIDAIEEATWEVSSEINILTPMHVLGANDKEEIEKCLKELDALVENNPWEVEIEELKEDEIIEEVKVELKLLQAHLKYVFLENDSVLIPSPCVTDSLTYLLVATTMM